MRSSLLAILTFASALLCTASSATAATFYVNNSSTSCSNTGAGTLTSPYCSISAALAAHHSSGTTIVVLPGVYHEQVTLPASGLSGSPIVLQAQGTPGNPVVVDGADDLGNPARWVRSSGNVWQAASVTWNPKQVTADNARLTVSTVSTSSLPTNSFRWVSGSGLFVNVGGDNPGNHRAEASRRTRGFYVPGFSWVVLDGFTVTHTDFAGIELTNLSSNVTLSHNVVTFSEAYGIKVDNGRTVMVSSNVSSDHQWSGIGLTGGSTGCTVEDNESFRNLTPNQANGIYGYGITNNLIQRNRVHDNAYNGIMLSTGCNDNVMRQNLSWSNLHQGLEDIFCTGNTHVGDVSFNNGWNGFAIEGGATGTKVSNCVAFNNSKSSGNADFEVDASSTSGLVSSDNLFWDSSPSVTVVQYGGTRYSSVAAYKSATGKDARTLSADPRFVNPGAGDFRPLAGSPLIDNANSSVANWPSTDAVGNARVDDPATPNTGLGTPTYADRGALEYKTLVVPNLPPVASLVLTPSSGVAPLPVTANASGSRDPESGRIASYRFDFGDGAVVGPQTSATATHTYAAAGTWLASVTVTDSLGATGTATARDTVRAANLPPVASLVLTPSSGVAPLPVTANASGSRDPESGRIASYRFDFGDGAVVGPQTSATATHTYAAAGTWLASVTVTDSLGATGVATAADTVKSGGPPVAVLRILPPSGNSPLPVIADGSGSIGGAARIVAYSFDFGDGVTVGPQSGSSATHTYGTGNWTATLTVTDSLGGVASASVLVPVAPPPPPVTGSAFYVDNSSGSCSNTGPGALTSPYCSISAALAAHHDAGTTIVVLPGVYREQVTLPASGTSGSPIVLQAQASPGRPVVVSGADDLANPALWVLSSGSVWRAASVTWSPKQVFADSVRLTASTAAPASLPVNSFVWVSGQGLFVNVGGDNPGNHRVEVGRQSYGFLASGRSWVVIDGFTVTRSELDGIEITNLSSNVTVTHNTSMFSGVYGIRVSNSTAVVIGSNATSNHVSSGIALTAGSTGCTLQDNESFRNLTPGQSCGIYSYGSPGNLIQRNRLHDNAYDGVRLIAGTINNVLVQNAAWNNAHHGFEDLGCTGNTHVGDVSYGNISNGFGVEGGATGTSLSNCVAAENGQASGTSDLQIDAASTVGFTSSDNLFWNASATRSVARYNGASYTTVAAYQAASGKDARTLQADPRFTNAVGGDFRPTAGSPLIDAANSGVANWPTTDAAGNSRVDDPATTNAGLGPVAYADRGAFEFQPMSPLAGGAASAASGGAGDPADLGAELSTRPVGLAPRVTPNPVRTFASFRFRLEHPATVRVRIFDLGGRLVGTLPVEGARSAGWNVVALDVHASAAAPLRSGIYLYEIQAGDQRAAGRFVVMR